MQRRYTGLTPLGLTFSKLAGYTSGGAQNHGFFACSFNSIKQPKFISADGGWDRIVWMPKTIKTDLAGSIPEEAYSKIATEEDAIDTADLKAWLKKVGHPIVEKYWKNGEPVPVLTPAPGTMWPGDEEYKPVEDGLDLGGDDVVDKEGVTRL